MAGAAGYLLKQVTGTELTGAVRAAAGGESLLAPGVAATVLARLRRRGGAQDPRFASLRRRNAASWS
jgi:DNA-binding NarL/FixJ family response regulator